MYVIYLVSNRLNGKRYVGMTGAGIAARKRRHLALANAGRTQCPRLYDAIRKYGADNFSWTVIANIETKEAAYRHERIMVSYLCPEYNVAPGGIAGPSVGHSKKPVICLSDGEIFPSTSAAGRFYRLSQSNISSVCRGQNTTAGGKFFAFFDGPMSDLDRRAAIAGRVASRVERQRKISPRAPFEVTARPGPVASSIAVICLDDGRVFQSASAAGRQIGCDAGTISRVCLGRRGLTHAKGMAFAYVRDVGQRMMA